MQRKYKLKSGSILILTPSHRLPSICISVSCPFTPRPYLTNQILLYPSVFQNVLLARLLTAAPALQTCSTPVSLSTLSNRHPAGRVMCMAREGPKQWTQSSYMEVLHSGEAMEICACVWGGKTGKGPSCKTFHFKVGSSCHERDVGQKKRALVYASTLSFPHTISRDESPQKHIHSPRVHAFTLSRQWYLFKLPLT